MQNTLVIILLAAAALFFLYQLIRLLHLKRRIQASQTWPQTSATVTEARVRSTTTSSKNGGRSRHYYGEVAYSYQVMDASFTGKFKKDKFITSQQWAEQTMAAYPAGSTLPVRYNPDKPQDALTGEDQVRTSEVITNVLLLVVMLALVVFYLSMSI